MNLISVSLCSYYQFFLTSLVRWLSFVKFVIFFCLCDVPVLKNFSPTKPFRKICLPKVLPIAPPNELVMQAQIYNFFLTPHVTEKSSEGFRFMSRHKPGTKYPVLVILFRTNQIDAIPFIFFKNCLRKLFSEFLEKKSNFFLKT